MGVGEVAGAHGDEVAEGAEVWLEVGDHRRRPCGRSDAIFTSPPLRTSECMVIS